jgi:hypothetical protein
VIRFQSLILPFFLMTPTLAYSQETNLAFGISRGAIQSTENISTAQIDGVLRNVAPSLFDQNFTRNKINSAFSDLDRLQVELANSLRQTIASQPNIRQIYSVNVNQILPDLRLSQKNNMVSGELGTLFVRISLQADVDGFQSIFCPSVNVTFDLNRIKAFGDYNYISGDISNANIAYDLSIVSASCNGIIGGLFNPTSQARSQINTAIQNQINGALQFANMKRLFSLSDLSNGIYRFRSETPVSFIFERSAQIIQEIVNDAAINSNGVSLRIYGSRARDQLSVNYITLLASHTAANIDNISCFNAIEGNIPSNTSKIDIYVQLPRVGARWELYESIAVGTETRFYSTLDGVPANSGVTAIATNATVNGLESFPDTVVSTNDIRQCNPDGSGSGDEGRGGFIDFPY